MMVKGGFTMAKNKKERPYGVTSGGEKLAYALGDLGSNFVWTFCSSWLTLYRQCFVSCGYGRNNDVNLTLI